MGGKPTTARAAPAKNGRNGTAKVWLERKYEVVRKGEHHSSILGGTF